ncbi:MAG: hypothetical protein WBP95_10205, partial [Acidobacteriaceae bacterium]
MNGLPECDEFFEMESRRIQNLSYIRPFGGRGSNGIFPIPKSNIAIGAKIDDGLRFAGKAMNVA